MFVYFNSSDEYKKEKLASIKDTIARNLVSQLLSKDPCLRPSVRQALDHPFIHGKKTARMIGEDPGELTTSPVT